MCSTACVAICLTDFDLPSFSQGSCSKWLCGCVLCSVIYLPVYVFNLNFHEVFSVAAEMHSVLCMVFNHVKDELITGGTGGMKVI